MFLARREYFIMSKGANSPRIETVDALRGFTLFGIILLHHIEHFDYYVEPAGLPEWLYLLDHGIWKSAVFFLAGKAYGIFALLFGFTFYLQSSRRETGDSSFEVKYLWRLFLLLLFGIFNSIFYKGDILVFYAILGPTLLIVGRWSSRSVLIVALIFLVQPMHLITSLHILGDPEYLAPANISGEYFMKTRANNLLGSFTEQARQNLTNGKMAVFFWSLESGRIFKTVGLFFIGMLLGRQKRFDFNSDNRRFWKRVFIISALLFIPLFLSKVGVAKLFHDRDLTDNLKAILNSWSNSAFMMMVLSTFVFLYSKYDIQLDNLSLIGRMSLTSYIMQSVIGSFIYYDYGLGMHKYSGATYSLFIGIFLFILQFAFCKWWLATHKQGPLESLWRRAALIFQAKGNNVASGNTRS